ncbi:MAG: chalcone isomerase family protein, partial [Candidatus Thiodiazotropha sp.]
MMRQIVFTCLFMACMMTIQAREIAGIPLPEQIVREADNAALVLNGAGIRKKVFFKIYLASLYLQQST